MSRDAQCMLQGMPFVPGRAHGHLHRGGQPSGPEQLLLLGYQDLQPFTIQPAGLLVIGGPPLAHPMIRLLAQGIPTVLLSAAQARELPEGAELGIDGASGCIGTALPPVPAGPEALDVEVPLTTADGTPITLRASVPDAAGAARARRHGASAIGLLRSEFLVPADGSRPDADFFERALAEVCAAARPLPVTVRLLDLAADKQPPWLGRIPGMEGPLGLRGARLYAHEPVRGVFRAEVEAIGRLAGRHALSLLLPYVTHPQEFRALRSAIEAWLPAPLPIGSMAETPAAALAIAELLDLAEFVALGCNDLMQCLFAADRDLAAVAELLDPYAPSVFRFLRQVAALADGALDRVQVCGLLGQAPGILPVLIGLGYRVFSVEPIMLGHLARTVRATDGRRAAALAGRVCAAPDAEQVRGLLGLPRVPAWAFGA